MDKPPADQLLDAHGGSVDVIPQPHHVALHIEYTGDDLIGTDEYGSRSYGFPFTPSQAYQLAAALMNAADDLLDTLGADQ